MLRDRESRARESQLVSRGHGDVGNLGCPRADIAGDYFAPSPSSGRVTTLNQKFWIERMTVAKLPKSTGLVT